MRSIVVGVLSIMVLAAAVAGVKFPEFHADGSVDASQRVVLGEDGRGSTGKFTVWRKMNANVFGQMDPPERKFVDHAASATLTVDGEKVIVVVDCPVPVGMKTEKSKDPWNGDRIEFWVHPQIGGKEESYFSVNCGGSYAAHGFVNGARDMGHLSRAHISVDDRIEGFTVTMTIPVRDLFGKVPAKGDAFGINFFRKGPTGGDLSAWAPVGGAFNTSNRRYGMLVFGGSGPFFRKRFAAYAQRCRALSATDKETESLVMKACEPVRRAIDVYGDDISSFGTIERMFAELDQALVAIALRRTPVIVYDNVDVWSDDIMPTITSKMIREVVLKAPRNTRRVKAFAIANQTDEDYLGNLKVMDDPGYLYWSARVNGIQGRFTLRRNVWMHRKNGLPCADPLVELPFGSLVELGAGKAHSYYLELDTKDMKPGEYHATLALVTATAGVPSVKIPVKVIITDDDLASVDIIHVGYTHIHDTFRTVGRKPATNVIKTLVSRGYNTVLISRFDGLYPFRDKDGVWHEPDYSDIDRYIDAWISGGLSRERIRVMPYIAPEREKHSWDHSDNMIWKGLRGHDGKRIPFGTAEYDVGARKLITDFMKHMKERHGLRKDQVIWYPVDEGSGDIDDPTFSSAISRGVHYAKIIKSLDRGYLTFFDPYLHLSNTKVFQNRATELAECFDYIQLYGPLTSAATLSAVTNAPYRGRWTYHISSYERDALSYRSGAWYNLRNGFEPECTYWHLDEDSMFAGSLHGYGSCYVDRDRDLIVLSRRQLANDMSFEEGKLVKYLRCKLADDMTKRADIEAIVKDATDHPTMRNLDAALEKLLDLL